MADDVPTDAELADALESTADYMESSMESTITTVQVIPGMPNEVLAQLSAITAERAKTLRLAAARLRDPWIQVTDRLPEDRQPVLLFGTGWTGLTPEAGKYDGVNGAFRNTDGNLYFTVTHWAPLPAPPREPKSA